MKSEFKKKGSIGTTEDKQKIKEYYGDHNDAAMSWKRAIATSKRDVQSTIGLQFLVIADTDDIQNIIDRTTDRAIAERIQPSSEEELCRKMPCKFSCCRDNKNGHFTGCGFDVESLLLYHAC